ncbi:hypothetical protein K523DRAFT_324526 [Schizophyllum commune Tattone D]|nr:hypothetical protein K523DRAFT_324526 [Schizophyllum commune Tattone D]
MKDSSGTPCGFALLAFTLRSACGIPRLRVHRLAPLPEGQYSSRRTHVRSGDRGL